MTPWQYRAARAADGLGNLAMGGMGLAVTGGALAATTLIGGASLAYKTTKFLGRGSVLSQQKLRPGLKKLLGRETVPLPPLSRPLQVLSGFGVLGYSMGAGMSRAGNTPLSDYIQSGAVELERPYSLGATGSLTLALGSRNRRGSGPGLAQQAMYYADDLAMAMV